MLQPLPLRPPRPIRRRLRPPRGAAARSRCPTTSTRGARPNQTHIYDETDDELERAAEDSAAGRTSTQQLGAVAAAATLAALLVTGRRAA